MENKKPRLTKKVRAGLLTIAVFVEVNQFEGSDLYAGSNEQGKENIEKALEWINFFATDPKKQDGSPC